MKLLLSLFFILMYLHVYTQTLDWQQTSHWKVYKIHRSGSLNLPVDSLQQYPHMDLGDDSVHYYVKGIKMLPKDQTAAWMGEYIATYEFGQRIRKIDISVYGGFFFDEVSKQYFELLEPLREDWLAFLRRTLEQMSNKAAH